MDSLRSQLRQQSANIDDLRAENIERHVTVKQLRVDLTRLQTAQKRDAQDLVNLAGRLLALSRAAGVELDPSTKELFRRRGWSNSHREQQS
ncbi:UNVERIFIED_ORG: glucose/arabinose dehydrogenase [Arthrobacter globiformis]|nr:glucose/arabinose dehydrogenase [Arthrobacter globiformis]